VKRIVIIGNAGSGKTHLAGRLAAHHRIPVVALDDLFWMRPGDYTAKRPPEDVAALVQAERCKRSWVVEGVYGELVEPFLATAQRLFWLDLPWSTCLQRITARQRARGLAMDQSFAALVTYAGAYWQRTDERSHAGHGRLFEGFAGVKQRLRSEREVNELLDGQRQR
jgi:adenylate kinase family enzyme